MLAVMFLIAVVITEVFCCFWKSQQLIMWLLFVLPQFALGLVNDFVGMPSCSYKCTVTVTYCLSRCLSYSVY